MSGDDALPPFSLSGSRDDQSTYWGRVRHFARVIDFRTLAASRARVDEAGRLLDRFRENGEVAPPGVSRHALWSAKELRESVVHPATGEPIFPLLRMSAFVPVNIPIVVGMIKAGSSGSVPGQLFWQWFNQSYNAGINVANASGAGLGWREVGAAYGGAVAAALGVNLALVEGTKRMSLGPTGQLIANAVVPYSAVASAGAINCYLMRRNETTDGISVFDDEGNNRGASEVAGRKAVLQSVLTRVVLPVPIIAAPPLIIGAIERAVPRITAAPRARFMVQVGVVTACLWAALPAAIGLFPQTVRVPAADLEPRFHNLVAKDGSPVTELTFNKGL